MIGKINPKFVLTSDDVRILKQRFPDITIDQYGDVTVHHEKTEDAEFEVIESKIKSVPL